MTTAKKTVTISAVLEIEPEALEAVVANAKMKMGRNEKGYYRIDTADILNAMISRFLQQKNFTAYAGEMANLPEQKDAPHGF